MFIRYRRTSGPSAPSTSYGMHSTPNTPAGNGGGSAATTPTNNMAYAVYYNSSALTATASQGEIYHSSGGRSSHQLIFVSLFDPELRIKNHCSSRREDTTLFGSFQRLPYLSSTEKLEGKHSGATLLGLTTPVSCEKSRLKKTKWCY